MLNLARLAVCASLVFSGAALGQDGPDIGALGAMIDDQRVDGWDIGAEGEWLVLENQGTDNSEQAITVFAGPVPETGRRVSVKVRLDAKEPEASVGLFLRNADKKALCLLEVTAAKAANLFCYKGDQYESIASVEGIAKLDGTDVLRMVEEPGHAVLSLNGRPIGELQDRPALGSEIGVMAFDRGRFGVTGFRIAQSGGLPDAGEAGVVLSAQTETEVPQVASELQSSGDPEVVAAMGPDMAEVIASKPLRSPWTNYTQDGWFVLENTSAQNDSFGYAVEAGAVGPDGRVSSVQLGLYPTEQMTAEDVANSTIGLIMQNRATQDSCAAEIMTSGDATLTCFAGDESEEIARLKAVAVLDGSDVLSLVEVAGSAQFLINDKVIGQVDNHPAQGGQIGIIAYNPGRYFYSGFSVVNKDAGQEADPEPRQEQEGPVSTDMSGGPLPMFDGDSSRITSTYLGVLTGVFLHEFGHALIGELQLPATGPEEDTVDIFSALRISSPGALKGPDAEGDAINQGMAIYAALQWYYSGLANQNQGEVPWQDEHTADLKRFRNTYCIMYGGNPNLFGTLADQIGIDERTLGRCEEEFAKQNRAWRTILSPYTRVSANYPEGQQAADAPGARIEVSFEPSTRPVGDFVKQIIGDSGTFQGFVDVLAQDYVLPRTIGVVFKDCGELNAWYDPQSGTITMCYDLIEYVVVLISDVEMGTQGGMPAEPGSEQQAADNGPGAADAETEQNEVAATGMDETADFGVPVTESLFLAPYRGPTPVNNPYARMVTTEELAEILTADAPWVLIDARGQGQSLPQAVIAPEAARDGSLTDGFQQVVSGWLTEMVSGDQSIQLIFFGENLNDRAGYNAALRAGASGAAGTVLWYRGGEEAWVANGLPLEDPVE